MNLKQFLSEIPSSYEGRVGFTHPEVTRRNESGEWEKRTDSNFHRSYFSLLKILETNPDVRFDELYNIAMDNYGFYNDAACGDVCLHVLEIFRDMGAVNIDGEIKHSVFGLPERGDAKFSLNKKGLELIEVYHIE